MRRGLITVGRISVDLYGQEPGAGFGDPQTFVKSIGGSPTNVAAGAARLGVNAAVATKVGADELGRFALRRLEALGVDTSLVGIAETSRTPVVLTALDPPEDPVITFFRDPDAPDTTMSTADIALIDVVDVQVLWLSAAALASGTTARAGIEWMEHRDRRGHTIVDLDYRPALWADQETARIAALRAIELSNVVVGNRTECMMAVGQSDPNKAADSLLGRDVELAVVKCGDQGVLLATADERVVIAPIPVELVSGGGAGDAFGGALVDGLLRGLPLRELGEYANAAGAYVVTQLMCADSMPSREQLEVFRSTGGVR